MARLTWHGHATFALETDTGKRVMFDPFLDDNPVSDIKVDEVGHLDYILCSHGHFDHFADAIALAKRTNATLVGTFELVAVAQSRGVRRGHGMNVGGGHDFPFGRVKLTIAHHGSSFPDGSYGGNPCGFLLTIEGKKIYHACDTGLFYDMKLIGEEGLDVAILPIGDNFTMGPADALRAVKLLEPRVVIPIHYNTFDVIAQDPEAFAARVGAETSARCLVLRPGQSHVVE